MSVILKYVQLNLMLNAFNYEHLALILIQHKSFFFILYLSPRVFVFFPAFSYPGDSKWGALGGLGETRLMRQGLTQ